MDTARSTKRVKPQFLEDRIVSDGTTVLGVDNRVGASVILYLVEKIIKENIAVKDFTTAFTTCEETSLLGSMHLGLNGSITQGFVFDSALSPGKFINTSSGAISFTIKVRGKAAHAGLAPEKGVDAIKIASNAISKLNWGRIDENTTSNIGTIRGGAAVNVVPEETEIIGEIRSDKSKAIEDHLDLIEKTFQTEAEKAGASVQVDYAWDFKPYYVSENSETYKLIFDAIGRTGLKPEASLSKGGSDANSLNARGINAVNIGIGAKNPHSNEEYILYEDFQKAFEIAMELVKK
jgi:tripeptide aminopeptidase